MAEGRCMKCKVSVEIKDPEDVIMKNGMKAIKGVCPKCSTKVFRIVGKADANETENKEKSKQLATKTETKKAA
jgi:hypothetical protein